jgi:hypothetical protein
MREANPLAGQAATGPGTPRCRLASPATVLVLAGLVVALTAVQWPLADLAHLSVNADTGGAQWWVFTPLGVVGLIVAWRRPANPLGWCFIGIMISGALSQDGSLYAIADYRLRHGTLPLGWVAMLAQPAWAGGLVLIGLAVVLFPDGRPASPLLRRMLWLYLALALVWMASAYVITLEAIAGHHIRVDVGGTLVALTNSADTPGWWNALQDVVLGVLSLGVLLALSGQVASYRHSSGERRQQLKWLLGGFAVCLVGVALGIALWGAPGAWGLVGHVALLAIFAVPVSMGVAILKYRLYDIDRIISRTLAYAIVTGLLIGVYAGLVLLATEVFRFRTPVAVAAATLAAAALFNPVRRRVQRAVDRRFNRARYDAEETVAAFAARLKEAVDLDSVRDDLTQVVSRTLEPVHLSLWVSRHD